MIDKVKPVYLLALGVVTITAANLNFSTDLAGWISCAPFLLYLQKTNGLKSRLLFVAGLKAYGKLNADLVADPSSDWRGIDPIHTKMAAFRAVEQGHSILRSTRFGLSAAITPYGEFASQMSSFDNNDKVMMAHLPVKKVTTVYSVISDSFVYICIAFIIFIIYKSYRSGSH
jgi:apolipoprotein N-acyltransferase